MNQSGNRIIISRKFDRLIGICSVTKKDDAICRSELKGDFEREAKRYIKKWIAPVAGEEVLLDGVLVVIAVRRAMHRYLTLRNKPMRPKTVNEIFFSHFYFLAREEYVGIQEYQKPGQGTRKKDLILNLMFAYKATRFYEKKPLAKILRWHAGAFGIQEKDIASDLYRILRGQLEKAKPKKDMGIHYVDWNFRDGLSEKYLKQLPVVNAKNFQNASICLHVFAEVYGGWADESCGHDEGRHSSSRYEPL